MTKFKVTAATNFLRVFRVPDDFSPDYCFDGGHKTIFMLIDWFNAFSPNELWDNNDKEFDRTDIEYTNRVDMIRKFIKEKKYFKAEHTYMVLTDYGDVFLVNPEKRASDLENQLDAIKSKISNKK
jgi:hypothetical protein